MTATERLAQLEAQVHRELELTAYLRPVWPIARELDGCKVHDVVILGGGQAGLTIAFALKRRGIRDVLVLDAAPRGAEGPWTTYAAMHTLRTPKGLTGPDQGLPSLTPESWYRRTATTRTPSPSSPRSTGRTTSGGTGRSRGRRSTTR